jgi:hypothetical protein
MSKRGESKLPVPTDPSGYRDINLDDLVTYAVYSLSRRGAEATFENVVAEAFGLFPERFSLRGFPQWPDSAVVNKSWLRCRSDKQYIVGSVRDGFQLTPRGIEVAGRLEKLFGTGKGMPRRRGTESSETRTREGRLVRSLEQSEAFRAYEATGALEHMSDYDFCEMLMCTLESSPSVLQANLEQFHHACEVYERHDLVLFLNKCAHRFSHLMGKTEGARHRGGMMHQRLPQEEG